MSISHSARQPINQSACQLFDKPFVLGEYCLNVNNVFVSMRVELARHKGGHEFCYNWFRQQRCLQHFHVLGWFMFMFWGRIFVGVYVGLPCVYSHYSRELPEAIQVSVAVSLVCQTPLIPFVCCFVLTFCMQYAPRSLGWKVRANKGSLY